MSTKHNNHERRDRPVALTIGLAIAKSYGSALIIGKLLKHSLKEPTENIDRQITHTVRDAEGKKLDQVMALMSGLGEPFTLYPIAGLTSLWWLTKGQKENSAGLLVSLLGAALMNKAIKASVRRPRPRFTLQRQKSSGSSFPSNHITMAFAVYGALAYLLARKFRKGERKQARRLRLLVWSPILLLCSLIAWSRIYQGVHHLTDVLVGWLVGGIWVGTGARVVSRLELSRPQAPSG